MTPPLDARQLATALVGVPLRTLTQQKLNRIIRVDAADVIVETQKSPSGEPVPLEWLQEALDRLGAGEEVEVSVQSLGHRGAFIGAFLAAVPGAKVISARPRRVHSKS